MSVRNSRRPVDPVRVVAFIILAVLSFVWLLPVLWAIVTSFKTESDAAASTSLIPEGGVGDFTIEAYVTTLSNGLVTQWAWNSFYTSVLITVMTVVISAMAGYALSRIRFTGSKALLGIIVGSILIPAQILIVPLFQQMLMFDLVDTRWGIILPQVVQAPMVFILKKFFDQIPRELEEAALMDGASRLRIFLQVVIPLSRPILAAVSIFVFIMAWNNFLWPFIITNDSSKMTLPVGLQTVIDTYGVVYAQQMAQAVLAALPLIVVFLFFQRQIIKGIATTGIAGK